MPNDTVDDRDPSSPAEADAANNNDLETAGEASPEERIAALEAELADYKDRLLRALAETENTRRRAQREREDAGKYAISGFRQGTAVGRR